MDKVKSVWGGVAGKVIALFLLLALIFSAVAITLARSVYGGSLLSSSEISIVRTTESGNGTVAISFKILKSGCFFANYDLEKSEDKIYIKFYSSVREGDVKSDYTGTYKISFEIDGSVKTVVQKGPGGEEVAILNVNEDF